ncbi:MAG: hypothetical protein ACI8UO_004652 [Verrucomicrobiales bacterium]|jgi:hypothetical protein
MILINRIYRFAQAWLLLFALLALISILAPPSCDYRPNPTRVAGECASDLNEALELYREEYNRLPINLSSALDYSGDFPAEWTTALLAVKNHPATRTFNPKEIRFLRFRSVDKPRYGGFEELPDGNWQLMDPWGRPFHLVLDSDDDGFVRIPKLKGEFRVVERRILAISRGADGEIGTEDDIRSE